MSALATALAAATVDPSDLVMTAGGIVSLLGVLGGIVWWLVWPRVEDKLQEVARSVNRVSDQLGDDPDTIGRHARVAASAAAELPAIRDQLERLTEQQLVVEHWRQDVDRRLTSVEGALLALLGPELRRRLFSDLSPETDPR